MILHRRAEGPCECRSPLATRAVADEILAGLLYRITKAEIR